MHVHILHISCQNPINDPDRILRRTVCSYPIYNHFKDLCHQRLRHILSLTMDRPLCIWGGGGRGQLTLEYRLQSTTGDVSYLIITLIIEVGYLGTYKASIVFGSKEVLETLP